MKKILLSAGILCSLLINAQTTIFEDNFEAGGGNWTLNGGFGQNVWIINNSYLASAATFGLIPDTPSQPGAITNSPNSNYLHIHNLDIAGLLSVYNANFDSGSTSDHSATMTNNISTLAQTDVTISFYYLCAGQAGLSYGNLEYSINNGSTWLPAGSDYVNIGAWTQSTVTMPEWSNQATLKFRFRWRNGSGGNDPAFAVDDVLITSVAGGGGNSITTTTVSEASWCTGTSVNLDVNFNATGTYTAGNVYTAQLSDASGSFASPTVIGSLASTASGAQVISCTIPNDRPAGTGYRIRVVSSAPSTEGTENALDLIIHSLPTVGAGSDQLVCNGESVTLSGSGALSYSWDNGVINGVPFTPVASDTYTVTGTDANGCSNTDQVSVLVEECLGLNELLTSSIQIYPNPANEEFSLSLDNSIVINQLLLVDMNGKVIRELNPHSTSHNISDLAAGVVFVRIITSDGQMVTKLIIE